MDPQQALMDWAFAVLSEDKEAANEAYGNLRAWFDRGGFEPNWGNGNPSRKQFFSYNVRTGMIE